MDLDRMLFVLILVIASAMSNSYVMYDTSFISISHKKIEQIFRSSFKSFSVVHEALVNMSKIMKDF